MSRSRGIRLFSESEAIIRLEREAEKEMRRIENQKQSITEELGLLQSELAELEVKQAAYAAIKPFTDFIPLLEILNANFEGLTKWDAKLNSIWKDYNLDKESFDADFNANIDVLLEGLRAREKLLIEFYRAEQSEFKPENSASSEPPRKSKSRNC